MSQRFASDTIRKAFSRPCFAVTFPGTTVIARTSSSGEFSASMRAMASSVPGSVSKIILRAEPEAGVAKTAKDKTRKSATRTGARKLLESSNQAVLRPKRNGTELKEELVIIERRSPEIIRKK